MKLRRRPEDFRVEELTGFRPGEGPFALYRMTKTGVGTPEAIAAVVRRWKIGRRRISYGGLKDRHALTRQFVTIHGGPRRTLEQEHLRLEYLGQAPRPFTPKDIAGNRFIVVMRSLTPGEAAATERALKEAERDGIPNYFDVQRFGSLGKSGEYVARAWSSGDYEGALWLGIAEENQHDRPPDRREKALLREKWRSWGELKAALPRGSRRSLVTYLADHPEDFRGALALTNGDVRGLWLSAFQSHLWNRLLEDLVREVCRQDQLTVLALKDGDAPFWRHLDEAQRKRLHEAVLPLPSARAKMDDAMRIRVERVMKAEGMTLEGMKIRHPKENFFSQGDRPAAIRVSGVGRHDAEDELYPARRKVELRFDLPRGAYATLLVKRLSVIDGRRRG